MAPMLGLTRRPRTGRDLRIVRLYFDIGQGELARALGVSRQRVTQLEAARKPSAAAAERFLAAVASTASRER